MMRKYIYTTTWIICTYLLMGCSGSSFISDLNKSQKSEFYLYQKALTSQFEDYELGRKFNSIEPVLDSLIRVMVGCSTDTIYLVESCNPPLLSYAAIIWNRTVHYSVYSRSSVSTMISNQGYLLMELIEKWNRQQIIETSKKKPLAYDGVWIQTNFATRMVFQDGKCTKSESIFFNEIDFDAKGPIRTIE